MPECPDDNLLINLAHGGVSGDALSQLEAHLDGCPHCRTVVAAVAGGSAQVDPRAPLQVLSPGDRMGHYAIERLIGAGGMGVLYVARDTKLDRRVALKLMRPHYADDVGRARLLREAQAMARLSHPNVVNVFELGEVEERVFVAMEFVEGGTLRDWLRTPRTLDQVLAVFQQAGQGLLAAHRAGIVHRDFKPENVLIGSDGRARVTDFGLARPGEFLEQPVKQLATGPIDLTQTGTLLGTPAYMSPEQLRLEPADARSDQYSFCVALSEALEGKRPFTGTTLGEVSERVLAGKPEQPVKIPPHVWTVLRRGMSLDPAARFISMEDLLAALQARAPRQSARWIGVTLGLSLAALAGLIIGLPDFASTPPPTPAELAQPVPPSNDQPLAPPKPAVVVEELDEPVVDEALPREGTELSIEPLQTRTFDVTGASTVVISNPQIADVEAGETNVTLIGAALGKTSLSVTIAGKTRVWPVVVRTAVLANRIEFTMTSGSQRELELPGLSRITVGDASIADATTAGNGRLRFVAGEAGLANVFVWTRDARRFEYVVKVIGSPHPPEPAVELVELVVGLQQVITFEGISRVELGDSSICEVRQLGEQELLLLPQRAGTTRLNVWSGAKNQARTLVVHAAP